MCKRFRDIHRSYLSDEDLRLFWYRDACHLGNDRCRLAYDLGIDGSGFCKDDLAYLVQICLVQYMASPLYEFLLYLIIDI